MSWLYLVILGQFIGAVVFLIDKYLVTSKKAIARAGVYAFYIGVLSGTVVLLLPFDLVSIPSFRVVEISLGVAFTYILSLIFLYKSLQGADASDVAPVMMSVSALATLVFGLWFLKSDLPPNFFFGFPYLIFGTMLMSYFRFDRKTAVYAILAGVLFGLSSVFIKMIFEVTDFWNGFFWSRIANVVGALSILLWPGNLRAVSQNLKQSSVGTKFLVVFNKALAGLAFFLLLVAIKLGDVSVVNALSGVQFVFLLFFAFVFTYRFPEYFHEAVHRERNVLKKVLAAGLIIIGFLIIFL